jgi:hypothetical protein
LAKKNARLARAASYLAGHLLEFMHLAALRPRLVITPAETISAV